MFKSTAAQGTVRAGEYRILPGAVQRCMNAQLSGALTAPSGSRVYSPWKWKISVNEQKATETAPESRARLNLQELMVAGTTKLIMMLLIFGGVYGALLYSDSATEKWIMHKTLDDTFDFQRLRSAATKEHHWNHLRELERSLGQYYPRWVRPRRPVLHDQTSGMSAAPLRSLPCDMEGVAVVRKRCRGPAHSGTLLAPSWVHSLAHLRAVATARRQTGSLLSSVAMAVGAAPLLRRRDVPAEGAAEGAEAVARALTAPRM
jgi:hypothetical protein